MAIQGPFTWFDEYLEHVDADVLDSGTIAAVLTTISQPLSASFVGGSGDCLYSDLTAELGTANGYTAAGVTLTGNAVTRSGAVVKWDADPWSWTLTGTISFRYVVLYDTASGRLICFSDVYTDGGGANLTAIAGILGFMSTTDGILQLERI